MSTFLCFLFFDLTRTRISCLAKQDYAIRWTPPVSANRTVLLEPTKQGSRGILQDVNNAKAILLSFPPLQKKNIFPPYMSASRSFARLCHLARCWGPLAKVQLGWDKWSPCGLHFGFLASDSVEKPSTLLDGKAQQIQIPSVTTRLNMIWERENLFEDKKYKSTLLKD